MKFVYSMFEEQHGALVDAAKETYRESHPEADAVTVHNIVNTMVFVLMRAVTFGIIKHVSTSVGLERLSPVFAAVLKGKPTIARRMIDLSIRLDHFAAFPEDQVIDLNKELQNSPLALGALKQLVHNRFYFFTAPYDLKQRICNKLQIKLQPMLLDRDPKRDK